MGCTGGLQSIVCRTPVIHLEEDNQTFDYQNSGYAHKFTNLHVSSFNDLKECLLLALNQPNESFRDLQGLERDWHQCFTSGVAATFAGHCSQLTSKISGFNGTENQRKNITILEGYSKFRKKKKLLPNPTKWISTPFEVLSRDSLQLASSFSLMPQRLHKVCSDLYLVSPHDCTLVFNLLALDLVK